MGKNKYASGLLEAPIGPEPRPPLAVLPDSIGAKPWFRTRLVVENGVRGWILEKLEEHQGQLRILRIHDVDQRDITLGHILREIELAT